MSLEPTVGDDGVARCWWAGTAPDYNEYHDHEWGRPVVDDVRLFEKICLEGFQSGLAWITILRKRENFRAAFEGAGLVVEGTFHSNGQEQFYFETQSAIATPGEDGAMFVRSSTQNPTETQAVVAEALGREAVVVEAEGVEDVLAEHALVARDVAFFGEAEGSSMIRIWSVPLVFPE